MGQKRYYCDFCDKYMVNNPEMRRNHNQGLQHTTAKRAHYARFKDPEEIIEEDQEKQKCRRYMNTGSCDYGDGCRFSHITPEKYQNLLHLIEIKKRRLDLPPLGTIENWLTKSKINDSRTTLESNTSVYTHQISTNIDSNPTQLAECLRGIAALPPSLLPPGMRTSKSLHYSKWG